MLSMKENIYVSILLQRNIYILDLIFENNVKSPGIIIDVLHMTKVA